MRAALPFLTRKKFLSIESSKVAEKNEPRVENWESKQFVLNNQWLLKLFGYYSETTILSKGGMSLFRAAKCGGLRKAFYTRGRVENDFRSQQVMITAHTWAIHKRLIKLGLRGGKVQETLFDELWSDTTARIRYFKFPEITINKKLLGVQQYCFDALLSFDHAVTAITEEQILNGMKDAVREHVYNDSAVAGEANIEALARYLLSEMRSLQDIDAESVLNGRIEWDAPPSFGVVLKAGCCSDDVEILGQKGDWLTETFIDGKEYYWNQKTYESTYNKPPELSSESF